MARHTRRQAIRLAGSVSVLGLAGCLSTTGDQNPDNSDPTPTEEPDDGNGDSCDQYIYEGDSSDAEGEYPMDLFIQNIGFSAYAVGFSISGVNEGTPEEVVTCKATSEAHSDLVFDLEPEREYKVEVTLIRKGKESREEASINVSSWNQVAGPNGALEVTVENGEFRIGHVHSDPPQETE